VAAEPLVHVSCGLLRPANFQWPQSRVRSRLLRLRPPSAETATGNPKRGSLLENNGTAARLGSAAPNLFITSYRLLDDLGAYNFSNLAPGSRGSDICVVENVNFILCILAKAF
jgi:hypothetical protein